MTDELDDDILDVEPGELLAKAMKRRAAQQFEKTTPALTDDVPRRTGGPPGPPPLSDEPPAPDLSSTSPAEYQPRKVDSPFESAAKGVLADAQPKDKLRVKAYRPVAWVMERLGRREVDFTRDDDTDGSGSGAKLADNVRTTAVVQLALLSLSLGGIVGYILLRATPAESSTTSAVAPAVDAVAADMMHSDFTFRKAGIPGAVVAAAPHVVAPPPTTPETEEEAWMRSRLRIRHLPNNELEVRERRQKEAEIADLQRLVQSSPSDIALRLRLARALYAFSRMQEAIQQYDIIRQTTILEDSDTFALATALLAIHDTTRAAAFFRDLAAKPRYSVEAQSALTEISSGKLQDRFVRGTPVDMPGTAEEDGG